MLTDLLVCPITGRRLVQRDGELVTEDGARRYPIEDGIARLFVTETDSDAPDAESAHGTRVASTVRDLHEEAPFPNYNDFETIADFVIKAKESVFARLLQEQIPMNANMLEVGCGTGQLGNFLAATCMARVYATDMTMASLRLGRAFARENKIRGVGFSQMNLFYPCIRPGSMDIVISSGVLHHTHDTKSAFMSIAPLVKPGGYLILGLYNRFGRLRTDLRRHLYKIFGEKILFLDPHLRRNLSPSKRRAWIREQYLHPQERKHTLSETLGWFAEAGFDFTNSVPKVLGDFSGDEALFQNNDPGTPLDRRMAEIEMLFSRLGGEGGLFIVIGRKR